MTAPQPPYTGPVQPPAGPYGTPPPAPGRSSTGVIVGFVLCAVLIVALLASTIALAVAWSNADGRASRAQSELATQNRQAADEATARDIASKYAAGAATFDYRDLGAWEKSLTAGTSPDLAAKLKANMGVVSQRVQPLQWVSKGVTDGAVVSAHRGSVFTVNTYVTVTSTYAQEPEGRAVLGKYVVTIDQAQNWLITDIGGIAK